MATQNKIKPLDLLNDFTAEEYLENNQDKKVFQIFQDSVTAFGDEMRPQMIGGRSETMREWSIRVVMRIYREQGIRI